MADWVLGFRVVIDRYLSDEPQPGLVAVVFEDVDGRLWDFSIKTAYASSDSLDGNDAYPRPGVVGCEVSGRSRDGSGRAVVEVKTDYFWEWDETIPFRLRPHDLVEIEWGTGREREWSG